MSYVCGRISSSKEKASKVFYKKIKPASKDALPSGKVGADCKCGKCSNSESQQRLKRLRTRKERDHLRDGRKQAPRARSCLHYHSHQTSNDLSYVHQCCTNTSDALPHVVPVTHEHSVITDSRLIGHHGLFNHEVKSFDIERLLSEQRKLNRSGKLKENRNSNVSAIETELLIDFSDKETTSKALQTPEIEVSKQQEKKTIESNSQGSELTPGQRTKKTLISSTETTKNNCSDVITVNKEALPVYESNSDSHQIPRNFSENKNIIPGSLSSFIEVTPRNTNSESTPPQPSSPPIARAPSCLKTQQIEDDPEADSVAMSVKAIAASLCSSISFSLLGRKSLVAESREGLVKVMQKRHGHQLRSNILKVQKQLYCSDDGEAQEEVPEPSYSPVFDDRKKDKKSFSTAEISMPSKPTMFSTFSFEKTGRLPFDRNSSDWSNPLDQTEEWMGAEHPIVQDGGFGRRASPPFSLDFDFRNSVSKERSVDLFSTPFAPACAAGPRSTDHMDHFFISTQDKEIAWPETSNDMRTFSNIRTERHGRSPFTSFVNYRNDPLHSVPFPQVHRSFETHKDSYGTRISDEIPYFLREGYFECSNFISTSPALRPQDMAHYPPSYMLERDPIQSTGPTFPSPEYWSFPPMRLY
ncbi:unnamed protein product [Knipowitschia caucasica]